jgi:hypothetical protein
VPVLIDDLNTGPESTLRHEITLPGGETFAAEIKRPRFEELAGNFEQIAALPDRPRGISPAAARFAHVINWRGVVDDAGAAVPFTAERLATYCRLRPGVFWAVAAVLEEAFGGPNVVDPSHRGPASPETVAALEEIARTAEETRGTIDELERHVDDVERTLRRD